MLHKARQRLLRLVLVEIGIGESLEALDKSSRLLEGTVTTSSRRTGRAQRCVVECNFASVFILRYLDVRRYFHGKCHACMYIHSTSRN